MKNKDNDSMITVSNIWVEDLFKWFFEKVISDGGDGAGTIICSNYMQVADWFVEWYCKEYSKKNFLHPKDEYSDIINFHDNNESFMFTNNHNISSPFHDYTFIVKGECRFGYTPTTDTRIILPL